MCKPGKQAVSITKKPTRTGMIITNMDFRIQCFSVLPWLVTLILSCLLRRWRFCTVLSLVFLSHIVSSLLYVNPPYEHFDCGGFLTAQQTGLHTSQYCGFTHPFIHSFIHPSILFSIHLFICFGDSQDICLCYPTSHSFFMPP